MALYSRPLTTTLLAQAVLTPCAALGELYGDIEVSTHLVGRSNLAMLAVRWRFECTNLSSSLSSGAGEGGGTILTPEPLYVRVRPVSCHGRSLFVFEGLRDGLKQKVWWTKSACLSTSAASGNVGQQQAQGFEGMI